MGIPLCTVVIPASHAEKTIALTLDSLLAQTCPLWLAQIVIDGSAGNEATYAIARAYADRDARFHIQINEYNQGVAAARNRGVASACTPWVAFLDSDDTWDDTKLSRQLRFMEEVGSPFTYTSIRIMDENGVPTGKERHVPDRVDHGTLLMGDPMPCLTIMIDTTVIPKEKIYMPNVHHEDYAAFLNCLRDGVVARGLDEVLASYRVSRTSVSGNKLRTATWQWRILRDQEGLSVIKSLYYLSTYALKAIKKRL